MIYLPKTWAEVEAAEQRVAAAAQLHGGVDPQRKLVRESAQP